MITLEHLERQEKEDALYFLIGVYLNRREREAKKKKTCCKSCKR
jgi:hypothetical protein